MELYCILFCLVYTVYAEDYYYAPGNVSRPTVSGIEAYRSALTLDWLAAEDSRQRELVAAYETEPSVPARVITTECNDYPRPSTTKVTKLILELLKNLEGDDGVIVLELTRVLGRSKLLMENTALYAEPDLDSLIKMPSMVAGQPHITFPRILAIVWIILTDATATKNNGWCPIIKVNEYLDTTKPAEVAHRLSVLEPVIARARFIMEEFIQYINPTSNQRISSAPKATRAITGDATENPASLQLRSKWKNALRIDLQKPNTDISPIMTEYLSTQFLEQAQHFADLQDQPSLGTLNQLADVTCAFSLVFLTLLF